MTDRKKYVEQDQGSETDHRYKNIKRRSVLGATAASAIGVVSSNPVTAIDTDSPDGNESGADNSWFYSTEFNGSCPDQPTFYNFTGTHAVRNVYRGVSPVDGGEEYVHIYDQCDVSWGGRYWPGFPYNETEDQADGAYYIHGHALDWVAENGNVYLPIASNDDDVIGVRPGEDQSSESTQSLGDLYTILEAIAENISGLGEVMSVSEVVDEMLRDDSGGENTRQWDYGDRSLYGTGRKLSSHFLRVRIVCDPGENATGSYDSKVNFLWRPSSDQFHSQGIGYNFYTPDSTNELRTRSSHSEAVGMAESKTISIGGEEREVGPLMKNPGNVTESQTN